MWGRHMTPGWKDFLLCIVCIAIAAGAAIWAIFESYRSEA